MYTLILVSVRSASAARWRRRRRTARRRNPVPEVRPSGGDGGGLIFLLPFVVWAVYRTYHQSEMKHASPSLPLLSPPLSMSLFRHSCSSSSVSVGSSAVQCTDGQTDIFQTEKQRQKGTTERRRIHAAARGELAFHADEPAGSTEQITRTRAQRAIVYCFTNQVNPNVAGNRLLFCHATMPFVRARFRYKSSSLPSDIFGGANSREPIAAVEIGVGQSAVSFLKVQFSPTF